ncbi:MAG: hypothetical protein MJ224_00040 [archaeon]|nr:hypothetical protein [archaeon]
MIVPEGCVVLDSDTKEEGDIIINCIREKRIKCFISKSSKGYHFYFRIPQGMKIKSNSDRHLPLGLVDIDFKTGQSTNCIIEYRDNQ